MLRAAALVVATLAIAAPAVNAAEEAGADPALLAACGVEIPTVAVNFGMAPFGDHVIYSTAMANGWFDEVGIQIGPQEFSTIAYDQILPLLVNGDYDVTSQYGPNQLQTMVNAPEVQQFTFSDTYSGLFFLAPPGTEYDTVPGLIAEGMSFEDAAMQAVGQLAGKRVAIDDTGSHRAFVDKVFELGGLEPSDMAEIATVDDARMLLLARGGQTDFAKPLGGAQTAELILDGWYPIIGAEDVIAGLPPGDPAGVTGIGHTGLATRMEEWEQDPDTLLRIAGVMFRVIDQIKEDIEQETDVALGDILPVLESAAAVDIGVDGLRVIYGMIDPMRSFEEQSEYWLEADSPFYFANVYQPQIDALVEGGVIPEDRLFTPDDAFLGPEVYTALVEQKEAYDSLVSQAAALEGDAARLAEVAATYYENRNYLDARRMLEAAIAGCQ
jgi:ABC-type nitrate/sulfonate/bicarbonate transport system substrate-binding protein